MWGMAVGGKEGADKDRTGQDRALSAAEMIKSISRVREQREG
jgi:hypothetical protein